MAAFVLFAVMLSSAVFADNVPAILKTERERISNPLYSEVIFDGRVTLGSEPGCRTIWVKVAVGGNRKDYDNLKKVKSDLSNLNELFGDHKQRKLIEWLLVKGLIGITECKEQSGRKKYSVNSNYEWKFTPEYNRGLPQN